MSIRRRTLASLPALALLARRVQAQEAPLFGARLATLPNGLTVAHVPRPDSPAATQLLWVKAGSLEDPEGRSGVAHFLEHMMFKGTPSLPAGGFNRRVAALGGFDNAFTSQDVTAYVQEVAVEDLGAVMAMEADRFVNALIPQAELDSEREVVLEERRQTTEVSPRARFRERTNAALWGDTPRGRPIIGWPQDIRATTRDDLVGFHQRHYAPGNAVLTIQGGTAEQVDALVQRHWAPVPARPFTPRAALGAPAAAAQDRVEFTERGIGDAAFSRVWMAPSLVTSDRATAAALEVLAHLLGGGTGSRLERAIVNAGLGVGAGSWYWSVTSGPSEFGLSASLRRGTTREQLEAAIARVLTGIVDSPPPAEEVARSIRHLTAGALLALDSAQGAARAIGSVLAVGLPIEEAEFRTARLRAVTAAEVHRVARAVLGEAPGLTAWLLPA